MGTPLEPKEALKVGSDVLGESFILFVACSIVVIEYNNSKIKERIKEEYNDEKIKKERNDLLYALDNINKRLDVIENYIEKNKDLVVVEPNNVNNIFSFNKILSLFNIFRK